MMNSFRTLLWRLLFLGLALSLLAEPMALAAGADDDADDLGDDVAAAWIGDGDDGDDDDDAESGAWGIEPSAATGRTASSTTRETVQLQDDDDDDDGCDVVDDDGDPSTDGFCSDQAIVRLAGGADIAGVNADFGIETIDQIAGQQLFLLRLPSGSNEPQFAQLLEDDPRVAWAELNFVDQAPEGSPRRFFPSSGKYVPQPGTMNQAYAPGLIGFAAVECVDGRGVSVAVIDTGLDADHPYFANTTVRDAWNAFSNQDGAGNVDDIGNAEDDDGDTVIDEMTGHGTHVAGIVAQAAPGAAIVPIKALDSDGVGQAFYLARAIYYALDRNVDVMNLSLGSTANTRIVREAASDALGAGIFVAAAAGNSSSTGPREFPATLDGVFGVAATDQQDRAAAFSSTHASLDLSAPGVGIVAAFPPNQPPANPIGSEFVTWSGTSMATPWVAGAAALLLERRPQWTPEQVADRLRTSAAPIAGSPAGMGAGRLDVAAAVDCGQAVSSGQGADNNQGAVSSGTDRDKNKKKKHKGKGKNKHKKGKNRR